MTRAGDIVRRYASRDKDAPLNRKELVLFAGALLNTMNPNAKLARCCEAIIAYLDLCGDRREGFEYDYPRQLVIEVVDYATQGRR